MAVSGLDDDELNTMIENYERLKRTEDAKYKELLQERANRMSKAQKLDHLATIALLRQAAAERKLVTYGEVAAASDAPWTVARHRMSGAGGHLDSVLEMCHVKSWPWLASLCVNAQNRDNGELADTALIGFVGGIKRVSPDTHVLDQRAFLRRCQEECFEWAELALS